MKAPFKLKITLAIRLQDWEGDNKINEEIDYTYHFLYFEDCEDNINQQISNALSNMARNQARGMPAVDTRLVEDIVKRNKEIKKEADKPPSPEAIRALEAFILDK